MCCINIIIIIIIISIAPQLLVFIMWRNCNYSQPCPSATSRHRQDPCDGSEMWISPCCRWTYSCSQLLHVVTCSPTVQFSSISVLQRCCSQTWCHFEFRTGNSFWATCFRGEGDRGGSSGLPR